MNGVNARNMEIDMSPLDPAAGDPGYWDRFQQETLTLARPLLDGRARRRAPLEPDDIGPDETRGTTRDCAGNDSGTHHR